MYRRVFGHCNLPLATRCQQHLISCHFFQSSNHSENESEVTSFSCWKAKGISRRSQHSSLPPFHAPLELQNPDQLHNRGITPTRYFKHVHKGCSTPGKLCALYVFVVYFWIFVWLLHRPLCFSSLNICLCNLPPAGNWVHVILTL